MLNQVIVILMTAAVLVLSTTGSAQVKNIFFDSDGIQISNDEFGGYQDGEFHIKDQTLVKTLEGGTVEFRLQKIPQEGMDAPAFMGKTV